MLFAEVLGHATADLGEGTAHDLAEISLFPADVSVNYTAPRMEGSLNEPDIPC